ncbi:MAG: hypothetical protein M5U01_30450 [Ardenticatenaceae bacterium]|nr:hypothetical protein [Ardenticatenaceae bacterium]
MPSSRANPWYDQFHRDVWRALDEFRLTVPIEPDSIQRIVLKLLAARTLQDRTSLLIEEALDELARQLDVAVLLLQPELQRLREEVTRVLAPYDLGTARTSGLLDVIDQLSTPRQGWHKDVFLSPLQSLLISTEPFLFITSGSSTFIPRALYQARANSTERIEFLTLEREAETVERLRLMVALVLGDLDRVRESVLIYRG